MKLILEELKNKENKKKFRELVMKHHPDRGGDERIMKKLTAAADKGDYAFEQFRDELLGKKKPQDTYSWKKAKPSKRYSSSILKTEAEKLVKILKEEFKDDKDIDKIEVGKRFFGSMFTIYIILKDGKSVAIEYTVLDRDDKIETILLDKNGDQLTIKIGESVFDKLAAPYARNIPSSVRTWIKHKDEAYLDNSWRKEDSGNDD